VGDEVLAGAAPLVGVVLAGEDERRLDRVAVDRDRRLGGVLLDDREQVVEEAGLVGGEAGAPAGARGWRPLDGPDRGAGGDRGGGAAIVAAGPAVGLGLRGRPLARGLGGRLRGLRAVLGGSLAGAGALGRGLSRLGGGAAVGLAGAAP